MTPDDAGKLADQTARTLIAEAFTSALAARNADVTRAVRALDRHDTRRLMEAASRLRVACARRLRGLGEDSAL